MKSITQLCAVLSTAVGLFGLTSIYQSAAADVNVTIYQNHATNGDGSPFGNPYANFTVPTVSFGTDNNWHWQPTDLLDWGAQVTGCFTAQETGDYTFGLVSDDGSALYLNNDLVNMVVDHTGEAPSIYETVSNPYFLNAGDDIDFLINYFEDFRGDAGLDFMVQGPGDRESRLVTAEELKCAETPEPSSLALLITGGLPLFGLLRRKLSF